MAINLYELAIKMAKEQAKDAVSLYNKLANGYFWVDQTGKVHKVREMKEDHIKNIIEFMKGVNGHGTYLNLSRGQWINIFNQELNRRKKIKSIEEKSNEISEKIRDYSNSIYSLEKKLKEGEATYQIMLKQINLIIERNQKNERLLEETKSILSANQIAYTSLQEQYLELSEEEEFRQ